jgi:hypothetical protein
MTNTPGPEPKEARRRKRQHGYWFVISVFVVAVVCLLWCAGVAAFRLSIGR